MAQTPVVGKEATILSLSEDIEGILCCFQETLDSRFSRGAPAESGVCGSPQHPNILDEIIGNLKRSKAHFSSILSFIRADVLPKID